MLSQRQELILKLVVDAYLASGKPVPSKEIAERRQVEWGPSTVRAELAALEAAGYLTHPHTSAGRVPTEMGYRRHVDAMMATGGPPAERSVELELRREIDAAMRETTVALARVTDLMALVTAPPETVEATIHRVEVLRLQPQRVMAVAIASNGAVAKRVFDFSGPVDPGLVEWSSSYLNESLSGMGLGARVLDAVHDVFDLARGREHRRVHRRPVALLEGPACGAGQADVVALRGHRVGAAMLDDTLKRGAKFLHAIGIRVVGIVGKDFEERLAEDRDVGVGRAQVFVARGRDREFRIGPHDEEKPRDRLEKPPDVGVGHVCLEVRKGPRARRERN